MTTTSVVQVTVLDEQGYSKTFNIDNPKDDLTLAQINNALQPALQNRWWYGNRGFVIARLESATYTTSTKTAIGGRIVSITPSSANLSGGKVTFTVEGGAIQGTRIDNLQYEKTNENSNLEIYATIEDDKVIVNDRATFQGNQARFTGTAKLVVVVGNEEISANLNIDINIATP